MARFPALPLWTDAYLADTTHLTTLQNGGYLLMLMTAWRDPECRLPDDDRYLARITRMSPATWRNHAHVLRAFWQARDGFLYQKRLSRERKRVEERSDKSRRAANAKWRKPNETSDADAGAAHCGTDASKSISRSIPRSMNKNSNSCDDERGIGITVGSLKAETYERAHELAPGYDVYYLESRWRDWNAGKPVRDPDRAYLGFVKKHVETNPL